MLCRLTLARFVDVGSERKLPGWQYRQPPVHPFHAQKHRLCGANRFILHGLDSDCKKNFKNSGNNFYVVVLQGLPAIGRFQAWKGVFSVWHNFTSDF